MALRKNESMRLTMRLGPFLAACLLWIDAVNGMEGSCVSEPCLLKSTVCQNFPCDYSNNGIGKRSFVPRGLQALIGRMQSQFNGRLTGLRLRRLQSEFLGRKRSSEPIKRGIKPTNPEFLGKRVSELLGKRDDAGSFENLDWKMENQLLGKRTSLRQDDGNAFVLRGERGPRFKFNSGRELLGKRSNIGEETPMQEVSSNEDFREYDGRK